MVLRRRRIQPRVGERERIGAWLLVFHDRLAAAEQSCHVSGARNDGPGVCAWILVVGSRPRSSPASRRDRHAGQAARSGWFSLGARHRPLAALLRPDHRRQRLPLVAALLGLLKRSGGRPPWMGDARSRPAAFVLTTTQIWVRIRTGVGRPSSRRPPPAPLPAARGYR